MDIKNSWITQQKIAHRGLHSADAPENSLKAFQNAIDNGYAIELDVHIIADDTLVVIHDETLKRIANRDGYVANLKKDNLKNIFLLGSDQTLPTFDEVLNLVAGKTPLLIEIKNTQRIGKLEKLLLQRLKNYDGPYAVQSFNPFSLQYFKNNAPDIWRGQLSGFFKNIEMSRFKKFVLKKMFFNKHVSCPHFISYEADTLPNSCVRRYSHLPILAWTVRSQEQLERVCKHCDNIIFENFIPR